MTSEIFAPDACALPLCFNQFNCNLTEGFTLHFQVIDHDNGPRGLRAEGQHRLLRRRVLSRSQPTDRRCHQIRRAVS